MNNTNIEYPGYSNNSSLVHDASYNQDCGRYAMKKLSFVEEIHY